MRTINRKAASQRGASITFALLIFLVCAVVSSVVIVAATAAGGRVADQADMDQRYYAVTAVARKLCSIFDGKEVSLSKTNDVWEASDAEGLLASASVDVLNVTSDAGSTPYLGDYSLNGVSCHYEADQPTNGQLIFEIMASMDESSSRIYQLNLTFSSKRPNNVENATTATVSWKLLRAEKVRADLNTGTGG